jgi:hypothetical protein
VTPSVRMLSAALPTAGRSMFVPGVLVCSVHTCDGMASQTLTPEGMQLKKLQGKIVFEYKTRVSTIFSRLARHTSIRKYTRYPGKPYPQKPSLRQSKW